MAEGNKRKFGNLRYPMARLENDSDFLHIKVLEYKPAGFETAEGQSLRLQATSDSLKNNEEILGQIFLPIPENITDSNGVSWGENTLNGFEAAGVGAVQGFMGSDGLGSGFADLGKKGGQAIRELVGDKGSVDAINAIFASKTVGAFGGSVSRESILARTTGAVLNPNMELLFGGVQLRTFNFDFDLAPRDQRESEEIRNIIRAFKVSMNAKNGSTDENSSGLFIKSPDIFQLTYKTGSKGHQFLHKFKPMAMLNMAVNYTGAGTYATYDNTAPIQMKLNFTLQELNPIYSEDYESEEGKEGTGF